MKKPKFYMISDFGEERRGGRETIQGLLEECRRV
jgi:hypothetical protein